MTQHEPQPRPGVWRCITCGEYEAGVHAADAEYAETGNLLPLRNKLTALIMLERYQEAHQLVTEIIRLDGGTIEQDFLLLGIITHRLNREESPYPAWESGLRAKYSDAAGGVGMWMLWLLHARINRLPDQAERALQELKSIGERCGDRWPGCAALIAQAQMGVVQLEPLLSTQPTLRLKQELRALFAHQASKPEPDIAPLYQSVASTVSATCLLPEFIYLWCFGRAP